jgi:hypothetical protein
MTRFIRLSIILAGLRAAPQSLDGVWQSQGYGNVYEIRGSTLRAFEVSTRTCVPGFAAKRLSIAIPGREATFKERGGGMFFIGSGIDSDHKTLNHPDGLSKIRIDRLPRMPALCDPPTQNTPLGNFEVFSRTFSEHYIAFDLKRIDWDKVVTDYRSKITPQTTPAQLFDIFEAMIKPFADIHTGIGAPTLKREFDAPLRPGTDRVVKGGIDRFATKGRRELFAVTDRIYLHGPLRKFCRDQIQYGHINDTTGYLRILSFGDYARHGHDSTALDSALDQIFSDGTLQALVIDVRLSFGGDDRLGLVIASRLATGEYLAYSIQARADPVERDKWTAADSVFVRPAARPGFRGPVVELIGPITMSAAETFTQALMSRTPHVTRIGESTQGVFCDSLGRRLPNEWTFALPNAVYRTAEGASFDVQGIPPDIRVPVFADDDVAAGRDPGMAMAVQILGGKK